MPNLHQGEAAWLFQVLSLGFLHILQPEITPTHKTGGDPIVCSDIFCHMEH